MIADRAPSDGRTTAPLTRDAVDTRTTTLYRCRAQDWIAARRPRSIEDGRLAEFLHRTDADTLIVDVGCGPGWNAAWMEQHGRRVIALDVSEAMLAQSRGSGARLLCGDAATLPLRDRSLGGAWAKDCYQHLPRTQLPLALAHLHRALMAGAPLELTLAVLDERHRPTRTERLRGEAERRSRRRPMPGRLFSLHTHSRVVDLMTGAGFDELSVSAHDEFWWRIRGRRALTLPDLVGPGLRLLICGLNPSIYSAERGIAFARPGNRFWPAMKAAGLIDRERDPLHAFERGIGLTDIVKRASASADELTSAEYSAGLERIERVVRLHRPAAVCFVGLDGWRRAIDRRAQPGWQAGRFGGRPVYLMPSTSGRNARTPPGELAAHLRAAAGSSGNRR